MKKVALTRYCARTARTFGVHGPGPSSKVSATVRPVPGAVRSGGPDGAGQPPGSGFVTAGATVDATGLDPTGLDPTGLDPTGFATGVGEAEDDADQAQTTSSVSVASRTPIRSQRSLIVSTRSAQFQGACNGLRPTVRISAGVSSPTVEP